jgi:histidinol-phosphate/aromatic aminotransferase/cobyric acid decarboxylase-like protein/choline kinase
MKGLILAAGFGNRMSPLTDNTHKTLLKINGEAIMNRIVSSLIQNGVNKIVIVTGYRAEELRNHLHTHFPKTEFEYVHNARYRETNNIFSLALAFEQIALDDDILLIESDLIYTADVIEKVIKSPYDNVALVSPYATGLDGTVVQISGHRITSIYPPHLQDEKFDLFDKYKTLNIYKFSQYFCANEFKKLLVYYAQTIDDNCYYELILGILIYMQRQDIFCEVIENEKWVEVDDPNDFMGAEFVFNKENRLAILEESFGGYWNYDVLDFCFIRNMYFPTESMIAEIRNNLSLLLTNYGSKQSLLNKKLSYVLQCDPSRLLALNGASQIYPILSTLFKEKKILLPDPSFGEYQRIFVASETYGDRIGVDTEEVEAKIDANDVVVFVNPNNPSGSILSTEWLLTLIDEYKQKFFIIDESFIEFSDQPSIMDFLEREPRPNVIVLRSMSKSYGLPGIRLGFVYTCDEDLLKQMSRQIPIWNLNAVAEFYLEIILKNKRALANSFAATKKDRAEFTAALQKLSIFDKVYPSGADFILVRTATDNDAIRGLVEYLLVNDSIYIKDVTDKFAETGKRFYRMAVRLPEEHSLLIEAITRFEKSLSSQ